ncbi:hypothetical protein A3Q56_07137, partial [Intoshia linei]
MGQKKNLTKHEKTKITKLLSEVNSLLEIASKIERNIVIGTCKETIIVIKRTFSVS